MALPYPSVGVVTAADLSTDPDVFPQLPGQAFVVERGSNFSTGVRQAASGREIRTAFYSAPLYNWKIKLNVLRATPALPEVAQLIGFFNSRRGKYGCFFYLDPLDNVVANEPFGTGDGTTTTFQLQRRAGLPSIYTAPEPVYACWQTPTVTVNGVATTAFSIGPWGQLTFDAAPAAGAALAWSGQYLFVCRFDQDNLPLGQLYAELWNQQGLPFVSLRP